MSSLEEILRIFRENFNKTVSAVYTDDVDALKDALDAPPKFYTIFGSGMNPLNLSCEYKNKKVFDYLLNLNCFDPEAVDIYGHSALHKAINNRPACDYFSKKLINAGVDVFKICPDKKTYLHHAVNQYLLETAKLLLEKGVDPNVQDEDGRTALHILLDQTFTQEVDAGVDLLLQYGADTAIYDKDGYLPFDYAVTRRKKFTIQEHLFYCTFDSHSADYEMQSYVFDKLLDAPDYRNVSPLLDNVMGVVSDVIFEEYSPVNFFAMPLDLLKKFIERYDYIIRRAFSIIKSGGSMEINIDNIEMLLLNSELHFEMVEFISKLHLRRIVWYYYYRKECKEELSSRIIYLLSYGLNVTSYDYEYIYEFQEYFDLFRTVLLHLNNTGTSQIGLSMMVRITVDIHFDLHTILASFDDFSCPEIEPLLAYFANSELRLLCERSHEPDLVNKVRQLPTVPSLLQLARDVLRRHIVRRYKLERTSQYYWVLRKMGIATAHEKILSFETKLYG